MEEDQADIFLTCCTNAVLAVEEVPELRIVNIPPELSVGASYGLLVLSDSHAAKALAEIILSEEGRAILARHGFAPLEAERWQKTRCCLKVWQQILRLLAGQTDFRAARAPARRDH